MRLTSFQKLLAGFQLRRFSNRNYTIARSTPIRVSNSVTSYPKPCPKHFNHFTPSRCYSEGRESTQTVTATSDEVNKAVEEINLKFVEAREEIDLAMESKETLYFNEEALVAKEAVKEVLEMFDDLLKRVGDEEKGLLRRSMGMKIEQLKAELEQLNE